MENQREHFQNQLRSDNVRPKRKKEKDTSKTFTLKEAAGICATML